MHRSTRDRLEELLTGRAGQLSSNGDEQATIISSGRHAEQCPECSSELHAMREQAEWVRRLKYPEDLELPAGFYARVMQRIEHHARHSIWYGLVYSPVGKRLAYASLSVALALGVYVMTAEHFDHPQYARAAKTQKVSPEVSGAATPAEQRDAVLVNLVSVESAPQ